MSPKTKKPTKIEKAPKAAKSEKSGSSKKNAKGAIEEVTTLEMAPAEGASEEESDEEESSSSGSSGGGGNAAALAAATSSSEMSASFKNFRHHPDMENFYRFIYENDLRLEALQIIDEMMVQRATRKAVRTAKSQAH